MLRLVKDDCETHATQKNLEEINSYFVKTVMLHLYEHRDGDAWISTQESILRYRYVDALELLIDCLEKKVIEHYFIRGENLLDTVRRGKEGQKQLAKFLTALRRLRAKYHLDSQN